MGDITLSWAREAGKKRMENGEVNQVAGKKCEGSIEGILRWEKERVKDVEQGRSRWEG